MNRFSRTAERFVDRPSSIAAVANLLCNRSLRRMGRNDGQARDNWMGAHIYWHSGSSSQPSRLTASSQLPRVSTMADNSQRRKGRGRTIPALNMAIDALTLAKDATSNTPANPVFASVTTLLTMIRVSSPPFRDGMFQAYA